jgi:hypothetical protein
MVRREPQVALVHPIKYMFFTCIQLHVYATIVTIDLLSYYHLEGEKD